VGWEEEACPLWGKSLTTAAHILATAAKTKIARICVV